MNRFVYCFALSFFIAIGFFIFLFDFDGLYGQDSYSYLIQCQGFVKHTVTREFYPPLYALAGFLLSLFLHNEIFSLQIISMISYLSIGLILYKIGLLYSTESKTIPVFILIAFYLSPLVVRSSILVMSDLWCAFLCISALYFFLNSKNRYHSFFFFLFSTMAILTRYAAIVLLFPLALSIMYRSFQGNNKRPVLFGLSLSVLLLVINFMFFVHSKGSIGHSWLTQWNISNLWHRAFSHQDGNLSYVLPNGLYCFYPLIHPGFSLIFIPCLFFIKRQDFKDEKQKMILISVILYLVFLAGIPFQNQRFFILVFPVLLVLLFPAFERIWQFRNTPKIILLIIPLQLYMMMYVIKPIYERNQLEQSIGHSIQSYEGRTLYSFDIDIALQGRGYRFIYKNLWIEKYQSFEKGSILLFNEEKFAQQWANKNPMLNYYMLQNNYQLRHILSLKNGWNLYEIN